VPPPTVVDFLQVQGAGALAGSIIMFDLTALVGNAGATIGNCGSNAPYNSCSPAGSPFTYQENSTGTGVTVTFNTQLDGYTGTSGTNYSAATPYTGIFSMDQNGTLSGAGACNGLISSITNILACQGEGGTIAGTWSAMLAPASIPVTGTCPPPATASWTGCYFSDTGFTTLAFSRNDPAINFSWPTSTPGGGIPSGPFSARWQGNFVFQGANYNFFVTSDAPPAIYIDGALLPGYGVVCTGGCEFTWGLTAGSHFLEVDYKHTGSGASNLVLGWATR